jgi:hypothetical protein
MDEQQLMAISVSPSDVIFSAERAIEYPQSTVVTPEDRFESAVVEITKIKGSTLQRMGLSRSLAIEECAKVTAVPLSLGVADNGGRALTQNLSAKVEFVTVESFWRSTARIPTFQLLFEIRMNFVPRRRGGCHLWYVFHGVRLLSV